MKTQRRRAVHAELVRESKDNPGYFRYNVTIKELDDTCHVVPAYGQNIKQTHYHYIQCGIPIGSNCGRRGNCSDT